MGFEYDSLITHVQNVKSSREFHGEDELLAVDFSLKITRAENEGEWSDIMSYLLDDSPEQALTTIERAALGVSSLVFDAEYDDVKINVRQSTKKVAAFVHAKISKFRWATEGGSEFISCNCRALSDGAQIGALCEQLRHKVRIETVSHQSELDLDGDGEDGA